MIFLNFFFFLLESSDWYRSLAFYSSDVFLILLILNHRIKSLIG